MSLLTCFYNATVIEGDISGSCRNFLDSLKYRHNAIALFRVAEDIAMAYNSNITVYHSFLSKSLMEEYECVSSSSEFEILNFSIDNLDGIVIEDIVKMPVVKRLVSNISVDEQGIFTISLKGC